MNSKGGLVFNREAMSGNAKARGGNVTAVSGGTLCIPEGADVTITERGMTDDAQMENTDVAATRNHSIVIGEDPGNKRKVQDDAILGGVKCQTTFGDGNTAVILLSGTGAGSDIFKQDVAEMKTLLTSASVGVSEDKIFIVTPRPSGKKTTISMLKDTISDTVDELKETENANFIFYYSGHFNKKQQFTIDDKEDQDVNKYLDRQLAKELLKIPAKYMLFILDMCHSGIAEVNAKLDDAPPPGDAVAEDDYVPRMWEMCSEINSKGDDIGGVPQHEKIVQWSSSLANQISKYDMSRSYFTKSIVDVMTNASIRRQLVGGMASGETCVSVGMLNDYVCQHMNNQGMQQNPVIKPADANAEYFEEYPYFAKLKVIG